MTFKSSTFIGAFALLFLLAACEQPVDPAPAVLPTTEPSTSEPNADTSEDIIELVAASPEATAPSEAVAATPTAVLAEPSEPATPEPVETVNTDPIVLTILEPANAIQIMTGSTLSVKGFVDPEVAESVTLNVQMGPHTLVTTITQVDAATGEWAVDLQIPHSVNGTGWLKAMTDRETAVLDIQLIHDTATDASGVTINLSRPGDGQLAVAGHPLFFEGEVTGAIDNTITIGLYTDDCTTFAARQSFSLTTTDAIWNGMVNLPATLNGRTCAFAYTGSPETGMWREEQLWLPSLHPDDKTIIGSIILGNANSTPFRAGESAYLFGSAVDAAGEELLISWVGEDGETLLVEGTAVVGALGYWEAELLVPAEALGLSTLTIQLGEGEDATILQHELLIES